MKYFFRNIGHAIGRAARSPIFRAIVQIVACSGPWATVACAPAIVGLAFAAGGSLKESLISIGISFASMGAFSGVGAIVKGISDTVLSGIVKIGLHAVVGGAISLAQGGSFATGAVTGAVSAGASLAIDGSGLIGHSGDRVPEWVAARTAVAAAAGGTASVLAGGKFANGAITGAFAQLFNGEDYGAKLWRDVQLGIEQAGQSVGSAVRSIYGAPDCLVEGSCTAGDVAFAAAGVIAPGPRLAGPFVRSASQRSTFLRGLADDPNTASWMKQWLKEGRSPPGYDVDHKIPGSIGGTDVPSNMRLMLRDDHRIHHKFYRPWEK